MNDMKHHLIPVVIGMAILAMTLPGFGKVFWTRRGGSGHAVFDTTPGWRRVYQTAVRINGRQGHLDIIGCDEALPGVMTKLKSAFSSAPQDMEVRQSESSGFALIRSHDSVTRLLTLTAGLPVKTIIFVLTQSPVDYESSFKPPETHLLDEVPAYPNSIAQFFIEDEEAQARLEVSTASVPPETVLLFLRSALTQNGYRVMHSTSESGPRDAGLSIFQKGLDICCVLVQASPHTEESVITVLHKQLRMDKEFR